MLILTRLFFVVLCGTLAASAGDNLLSNGDFADGTKGWWLAKKQRNEVVKLGAEGEPAQALQVEVVTDGGKSYGEIRQSLKAKPNTTYVLTGTMKSSKANLALFQVKLRKSKKELKRIPSKNSTTDWKVVELEFESGDADQIQVLCRYRQSANHNWVGETAWFADLKLVEKE